MLPQRRERVYFVGVRRDLLECNDCTIHKKLGKDYVAFASEELKQKYQIYNNDLNASVDKKKLFLPTQARPSRRQVLLNKYSLHSAFLLSEKDLTYARLLQRLGLRSDECEVKMHLPTSKIGDILDADDKISSHCLLTMHQWQKVQSQTYLQLHNDGAGQLVTKDEACSQTLVSSYRQSYLLHSQFIVSNDCSHLARQEEKTQISCVGKDKTRREYSNRLCGCTEKGRRATSSLFLST
jgi:site-specific DNA-cytosine methylase